MSLKGSRHGAGHLIEKVIYKRKGDSIVILASVTTPRILSPKKINRRRQIDLLAEAI